MKNKFYFVKSSNKSDKGYLTLFTKSAKQAIALAQVYYLKHNYKGLPLLISV